MRPLLLISCLLLPRLALAQSEFGQVTATDCPSQIAVTKDPAPPISDADFIELQRTRCYGSCPSYTVRIQADGSVQWHGEFSVNTKGDAAGQIDPAAAKALIQSAQSRNFWSLCGGYHRMVTDLPTYRTTLSIAGETKTVSDYAQAAPTWLQKLEIEIDAVADTYHWRKGDPAKKSFDHGDSYLPKPGLTPLMKAATSRSSTELAALLKAGADPDAEDASGWTALTYAAGAGKVENVRLLLAARAKPDHRSKTGETPIFAAVIAGWSDAPLEIVELLKEAGSDINAQDHQGNSPLMLAVRYYRVEGLIAGMLRLGANPRLKNQAGQTAADILASKASTSQETQAEDYIKIHDLLTAR